MTHSQAKAIFEGGALIKMPGIDGITLYKTNEDVTTEIPIAIFTGFDQTALTVPPEADAFVIKSSSHKELKEFIRRYAPRE